MELSQSKANIRGIVGGNRTGKTEWGAHEASEYLKGTHPYRSVQVPSEIWIGTPSFDTQVESAQPKLLKFLGEKWIDHVEYYQSNKIKTIYGKNGSKATFKSYEQAADKWAGAEKRLIWFDEEPPHQLWTESIVRQGRGVTLDIIFTLTPVNGMTWFYDEVFQQAQAKGIDIKMPRWEDNIHLTVDQIRAMEMMLTPEELEVRKFGRFIRGTGMVCSWWRRDIHIKPMADFDPRGCTVYVGIDFGFTTSFTAAVFIAVRRDTLYLFDGIYEKGLTTPALASKIKQKLGSLYVHKWVADSAASSDIAELIKYGIPVQPVKKETGSIKVDWDTFRARKLQEVGAIQPITGEPRLYVSDQLLTEIDGRMVHWFSNEAENVRWKHIRTADGSRAQSIWSDEKNKDALDALSYVLVNLPMDVSVKYHEGYQRKSLIPKQQLFDENGFYI